MKRVVIVAALAASASFAQEKAAGAPAEKLAAAPEAQPAAHAMPAPPAELSVEKWFVGTWNCKGVDHAGPMGPEHKTSSQLKMKLDLAGYWLEVEGTAMSGPMKGKEVFEGFSSWDGTQHQRFDFQPGGMIHLTSKGWEGDKLVFEGEGMTMGTKSAWKHTITRKGNDAFENAFESDGKPTGESTCTRATAHAKK